MCKKIIIRIEDSLEEKINLSSLKLKDNEDLIIDDGNFEHNFHKLLDEKYEDKLDVVLINVMSNKVDFYSDWLKRTLINVAEDMPMKDFVSQLLEVINSKDTNFVNFIKYSPYFQLTCNPEINILFNNMDLENVNVNNLIIYDDRITLCFKLIRYPNITYSCLDDNKDKGFIYYKERPLKYENI